MDRVPEDPCSAEDNIPVIELDKTIHRSVNRIVLLMSTKTTRRYHDNCIQQPHERSCTVVQSIDLTSHQPINDDSGASAAGETVFRQGICKFGKR